MFHVLPKPTYITHIMAKLKVARRKIEEGKKVDITSLDSALSYLDSYRELVKSCRQFGLTGYNRESTS